MALISYAASTGSLSQGLRLLFSFSLGLGAPQFGLALVAGRLRRLPTGGTWTVWVERMVGLLLFGLALYLAAPFIPKWAVRTGNRPSFVWRWTLLFVYGRRKGSRVPMIVRTGTFLVGAAVTVTNFLPASGGGINWTLYTPGLLAQAVEQGKSVLVYFSADWCPPCWELSATTFCDPQVLRELSRKGIWPVQGPAEDLGRELAVIGVPTLVLIDATGKEARRIAGYINPKEFINFLLTR